MQPRHILIVDDSALITGALRVVFEAHNFRVSTANNLSTAIECAQREHVDVMFLDLALPDGDGLSLLTTLAAQNAAPVATVAFTGHDDSVIRERCLAAGCRAVLLKPAPTSELVELARSL